jgi:hypothetical protein
MVQLRETWGRDSCREVSRTAAPSGPSRGIRPSFSDGTTRQVLVGFQPRPAALRSVSPSTAKPFETPRSVPDGRRGSGARILSRPAPQIGKGCR